MRDEMLHELWGDLEHKWHEGDYFAVCLFEHFGDAYEAFGKTVDMLTHNPKMGCSFNNKSLSINLAGGGRIIFSSNTLPNNFAGYQFRSIFLETGWVANANKEYGEPRAVEFMRSRLRSHMRKSLKMVIV